MQILVNSGDCDAYAAPHFRGMQHVVIASFGRSNIFVFDLLRKNVAGVISERLAADRQFWDRTLLPILAGVLGPAVGVIPIHAACLAVEGAGLLIAGASGAGKSTLSVALAQNGFDFVSDDWTYLSSPHGKLLANGMSVPAKLLPDAISHFPVLARYSTTIALNQELAYELTLEDLGVQVRRFCEPRWFFFLERKPVGSCRILPVSSDEACHYLDRSVERLPAELESVIEARSAVIEQVQRLCCWKLTYNGPPEIAVSGLQRFLAEQPRDRLV
jgi:hypothetical protein